MTCDEADILLHALIDGELDAGHAREVENHVAACRRCTGELEAYREMKAAMATADMRLTAPPPCVNASRRRYHSRAAPPPLLLAGFALGRPSLR